jgi:hypothetical protein
MDTLGAPTGIPSHLKDQAAELLGRARPAHGGGLSRLVFLADPPQEGVGRDDGDQLTNDRAQRFAEAKEQGSFLRGDGHARAQLGTEDAAFDDGVLKLENEFIVAGSCEHKEQALPEVHSVAALE